MKHIMFSYVAVCDIILFMTVGEVPKRLKGPVSKTGRRESVRGFEPLLLRHLQRIPQAILFSILPEVFPTFPPDVQFHYEYHRYPRLMHSFSYNPDSIPVQTAML